MADGPVSWSRLPKRRLFVGIAHFLSMRTAGREVCYLQDLFTMAEARQGWRDADRRAADAARQRGAPPLLLTKAARGRLRALRQGRPQQGFIRYDYPLSYNPPLMEGGGGELRTAGGVHPTLPPHQGGGISEGGKPSGWLPYPPERQRLQHRRAPPAHRACPNAPAPPAPPAASAQDRATARRWRLGQAAGRRSPVGRCDGW